MGSAARAALFDVPPAIRATLERSDLTPEFHSYLESVLSQRGRALHGSEPGMWSRIVVETALSLGGSPRAAVTAAAAVELAATAIDLADELMDGDWQGAPTDIPRAQNASIALSFLAHAYVAQLNESLGPDRASLISRLLAEGSVACCDGQDLDVVLERTNDVTEELAHEMTRRKSGSLVAMACRVGAAVATSDPDIISAAGQFGTHVGLVAQLLNDLNDVATDPAKRKGDLQHFKKTLPVAFALRYAREEGNTQILDWYTGRGSHAPADEQALALTLHRVGAHQYAWAVADVHRREALRALKTLAAMSGRAEVSRLKRIVATPKGA